MVLTQDLHQKVVTSLLCDALSRVLVLAENGWQFHNIEK